MPVQKAEALFDFDPTADVELELKKGDVVSIRRMSVGEGWWEGEITGRRGLFPSSYVKLLPIADGIIDRPKTPLTPKSSKKAFMETLLTPAHSTQEEIFDKEKVAELFMPGHTHIGITVGPRWDCDPPSLTITIKDPQTETRFSGMKHYTVYEVETKELGVCVTRRYKHFLWLYDRLAECFPCISLPPLPVKQFSGSVDAETIEMRRRGLEAFTNRIAGHPLLASTKSFHDFLTIKDDKEWKIGRHSSHVKVSKTTKRMFIAPIYCTVKYPPYNVPLNQLTSIDRFEKFSRLLEMNVHTLQQSYQQLSLAHGDMMSTVNLLGRDFQRFAKGMQPTTGVQRRKLQTASSVQGISNGQSSFYTSAPHSVPKVTAEVPDEEEEEEEERDETDFAVWNWRDDTRFSCMAKDLHDVASGMRRTGQVYLRHQEAMEQHVLTTLKEYSGIVHTLPMLVKMHEDAMETYKYSKEKDSKKEAEEVRQNCETLNNVLLAEFDYFSNNMAEDFEGMMTRFLKQQVDFHRQLADEWDALHSRYTERVAKHKAAAGLQRQNSRHSSPFLSIKTAHSKQQSYASSGRSSSIPSGRDQECIDGRTLSNSGSRSAEPAELSPYINVDYTAKGVDRVQPASANSSEEELTTSDEMGAAAIQGEKTADGNEEGNPTGVTSPGGTVHYENWQFMKVNELQKPTHAPPPPPPPAPKKNPEFPKKPVPIQRKHSPTSTAAHPLAPPTRKPPPPPIKVTNEQLVQPEPVEGQPSEGILSRSLPESSLPPTFYSQVTTALPAKKLRPQSDFPTAKSKLAEATSLDNFPGSKNRSGDGTKVKEGESTSRRFPETKPRSHTTTNIVEKKQPIFPPPKPPHGSNKPFLQSAKPPDEQTIAEVSEESSNSTEPAVKLRSNSKQSFLRSDSTEPPKFSKSAATTAGTNSTAVPPTLASKTSKDSRFASGSSKLPKSQSRLAGSAMNSSSGGSGTNESELMRKLSVRRQKIDQQIAQNKPDSTSTIACTPLCVVMESPSERTSTSSSQSELVVSYSSKDSPSNSLDASALLRKPEDGNLAKFGIIEDVEGGSYVI